MSSADANKKREAAAVSLPVIENTAGDGALWYEAGLSFKCTQCGNCCSGSPGYVWVSLEDVGRIAAFKGMALDDFTRKYVRIVHGALSLTELRNYDCVFLHREGGKAMCSIYPVRPGQCKTWPFWNQNLNSPQAWATASENCPGMRDPNAPRYAVDHIEKNRLHPDSP